MQIPQSFLDEIRARLPISQVIGKRLPLKPKGRGEFAGVCPFHDDHDPSMSVTDVKGFYHCFACNAHGDVLKFVMEFHGLSFMDAVKELAGEAGLPLPQPDPVAEKRYQQRQSLAEVMELACQFYQAQLKQHGRVAVDYIKGRGLSAATVQQFRLGYAPDDRGALKQALMNHGVSEQQLIEGGLLIQPPDGKSSYDRFRGRVMFPIMDVKGRVIAFGGRILGDGEPKYLNSPETPLFHKGRELYHFNVARQAGYDNGQLVIVEGYMDVIALAQAGLPNVVAPLGTALTEDQVQKIWQVVDEPILCMDGDKAGQRAMQRVAGLHLQHLKPGKSLRFVMLPEGKDPDDVVKDGGLQSLQKQLEQAVPLVDVLWDIAGGNQHYTAPEQRAAFEQRLMGFVAEIQDPVVQRYYRQAYKDRLWQWQRGQGSGKKTAQRVSNAGRMGSKPQDIPVQMRVTLALLRLLLNYPILLEDGAIEETLLDLPLPDQAESARQALLERGEDEDPSAWQSYAAELPKDGSMVADELTEKQAKLAWDFLLTRYELSLLEAEQALLSRDGNTTMEQLQSLSEQLYELRRLEKMRYIAYESELDL